MREMNEVKGRKLDRGLKIKAIQLKSLIVIKAEIFSPLHVQYVILLKKTML